MKVSEKLKGKGKNYMQKNCSKRKVKQNNGLELRESEKGWIKDVDKQTEY